MKFKGSISHLAHKLGNDAVEDASLVVEVLSGLADSLLSGAQAAEVLGSLGADISAQLGIKSSNPLRTSNSMRPTSLPPAENSMNTLGFSARVAIMRSMVEVVLAIGATLVKESIAQFVILP